MFDSQSRKKMGVQKPAVIAVFRNRHHERNPLVIALRGIGQSRKTQLLHGTGTRNLTGFPPRGIQSRKKNSCQNRDDCNYDQEFYQCKIFSSLIHFAILLFTIVIKCSFDFTLCNILYNIQLFLSTPLFPEKREITGKFCGKECSEPKRKHREKGRKRKSTVFCNPVLKNTGLKLSLPQYPVRHNVTEL